jgi:hypothetical protein
MRAILRLAPLPLLLILPLAVAGQAAAQSGAPQMIRPQQQPQAGPAAPAPALPGLAARRAPAPIAGDPAANLSPNAALFDAIARGDLAAARDAVGRGANLDARNALGITPLDAAVDQGRHDIVFYLLSTRDIARGPVTMEPSSASLAAPPAAPRAAPRREPARPAAASAPSAPRNARLWAGDGGAARPEVGFLGFDAGRPAGAAPPAGSRAGRS